MTGRAGHVGDEAGHVTGRADHVGDEAGHVTGENGEVRVDRLDGSVR